MDIVLIQLLAGFFIIFFLLIQCGAVEIAGELSPA